MIDHKMGDPSSFPFIDPPNHGSIKDGFDLLEELGAIEKKGSRTFLTGKGRVMAEMPIDPRIPLESLEWGAPGLRKEKLTALIKGLPKRYRKQLIPVSGTVDLIIKEMEQSDQSLINTLTRFIYIGFGVDIPASVWNDVEIPRHLLTRVAVLDHDGREINSGRNLPEILQLTPVRNLIQVNGSRLRPNGKKMKLTISLHASEEKRKGIEELRWILEEFDVSLFAQELGTAFPVSVKRLEKKIKELERIL